MKRTFIIILVAYVLMQLSGAVGPIPLMFLLSAMMPDATQTELINYAIGWWVFISFTVGLIVIGIISWRRREHFRLPGTPSDSGMTVVWAVAGIFIAFFSQAMAGIIESQVLGIEPGSENTQQIVDLMSYVPLVTIAVAVFGPILEEIVFRGVIFGWMFRRFNFFISAMTSSLVFALIHFDFVHLLIYAAMGFAFSFLYAKTKRLIVPIIAHMAINTFVVLVQFVFPDEIQRFIDEAPAAFIQIFLMIGGIG